MGPRGPVQVSRHVKHPCIVSPDWNSLRTPDVQGQFDISCQYVHDPTPSCLLLPRPCPSQQRRLRSFSCRSKDLPRVIIDSIFPQPSKQNQNEITAHTPRSTAGSKLLPSLAQISPIAASMTPLLLSFPLPSLFSTQRPEGWDSTHCAKPLSEWLPSHSV